jgi:hypothetical protein
MRHLLHPLYALAMLPFALLDLLCMVVARVAGRD